jgi:hypothetical protein
MPLFGHWRTAPGPSQLGGEQPFHDATASGKVTPTAVIRTTPIEPPATTPGLFVG